MLNLFLTFLPAWDIAFNDARVVGGLPPLTILWSYAVFGLNMLLAIAVYFLQFRRGPTVSRAAISHGRRTPAAVTSTTPSRSGRSRGAHGSGRHERHHDRLAGGNGRNLLVIFFIGRAAYSRNIKGDLDDQYLVGRSLNPFVLVGTLFAIWFSTFAFLGGPGTYYLNGVNWLLFGFFNSMGGLRPTSWSSVGNGPAPVRAGCPAQERPRVVPMFTM